jgi:hypothetical protein
MNVWGKESFGGAITTIYEEDIEINKNTKIVKAQAPSPPSSTPANLHEFIESALSQSSEYVSKIKPSRSFDTKEISHLTSIIAKNNWKPVIPILENTLESLNKRSEIPESFTDLIASIYEVEKEIQKDTINYRMLSIIRNHLVSANGFYELDMLKDSRKEAKQYVKRVLNILREVIEIEKTVKEHKLKPIDPKQLKRIDTINGKPVYTLRNSAY